MKKWFLGLLAFLFSLTFAQSQTTHPATNTLSIVTEEQFGKILPNQSNLYLIYSSSGWSIWKMRPNDLSSPASANIRVHPTLKIRFERIPLQGTISGGSSGGVNNISVSQISDLANIYPPKWSDVTLKPDVIANLTSYLGAPYRTFQSARANAQADINAFYITNAYQQGLYVLRPGDTTTPDDTSLVIKDALNRRFERVLETREYNIMHFGAIPNDNSDDSDRIQRAIDKAAANGITTVYVPNGIFKVQKTVYLKPGVKLMGNGGVGEYYNDYAMSRGCLLLKDAGSAGPILELSSQSIAEGLSFKNTVSGTGGSGIVRFGGTSLTTNLTEATLKDCYIFGHRTGNTTNSSTCFGVYFPESQTGYARYFNSVKGVRVNSCDVAVRLNGQSNGNDIEFRGLNCLVYIDLNGGSTECIENEIHLRPFATEAFSSPYAIVARLKTQSKLNQVFFVSETYGQAFDMDDTCIKNDFYVIENEAYPSHVGKGNVDHRYARPINIEQYQVTYLPSRTTGDRWIFGRGAKASIMKEVTGTLPQLDNNAGTPTAADADTRIIARFGADFFRKSQRPNFNIKLRVWCNIPYGAGYQFAEINLLYRCTNTVDGSAVLSVLSATKKGDQITGLHFITSVSSPDNGFALALTGGSYGAYNMDKVWVSMDIESLAFNSDEKAYPYFHAVNFVTEPLTSADVTDAKNILATGDINI